MQWSEMVAAAGLGLFVIVLALIAAAVTWRTKTLEHEERRQMIEKGMQPPPQFGKTWPEVKQQENQLRFEERRLMIEKGLVPPPYAADLGKRWQRDDFLRRGVITLFVGIGLGIAYLVVPDAAEGRGFLAFLSPTLALFGLGCLTYYRLSEGRATRSAISGERVQ